MVQSLAGPVLCEVKDFDLNDEDRAELDAARAGRSTFRGRGLPFARIQRRIRDARNQLHEYKGRHPCLVVLFDPFVVAFLSELTVLGAMYGESRLSVPIGSDGGDVEARTVFDYDTRYLTPRSNTTVSAVAILDRVRPNQRMVEEAVAKQHFQMDDPERTVKIVTFLEPFYREHPEVFEQVPRLQIFRNIYAAVPWPDTALSGPHDLMWPK